VAASSCVIDYSHQFRFPVPPAELWAAIEDTDRFEGWWGWLHDLQVEGPGLTPGSVLRGVVAPPLPYRMALRVVLGECRRPHRISAEVHGDLEGVARLILDPDGPGTVASVSWRIEMMQPPMRAAARFAHPLLRWGHDRVVEVTVASFRRHLASANTGRGS
jgi:carbon monoxide dehydrogenase subunit G